MPVTIASTGLFNGGVLAGLSGANAAAYAVTGPGSGTSASAGLARVTATGQAATVTLGTAGLCGDDCVPSDYGGGTQAAAITDWQSITGRTLQVLRYYYSGLPPSSISTALQALADAGIAVALSFKPTVATTSGGGSSTDRSTINSFLSSCSSYGLNAMVAMYHEPCAELHSASNYGYTQAYYGPTVRSYYPLVFSGQCGDFTCGSLATFESYYSAATTSGATFDTANVDYYATSGWTLGGSTLMDSFASFTDGQGLSSFGTWEWNLDYDGQGNAISQSVGTAFGNYIASFYSARSSAGKGIGYVTHFSLGTGMLASGWQIPVFDSIWDAVNG